MMVIRRVLFVPYALVVGLMVVIASLTAGLLWLGEAPASNNRLEVCLAIVEYLLLTVFSFFAIWLGSKRWVRVGLGLNVPALGLGAWGLSQPWIYTTDKPYWLPWVLLVLPSLLFVLNAGALEVDWRIEQSAKR